MSAHARFETLSSGFWCITHNGKRKERRSCLCSLPASPRVPTGRDEQTLIRFVRPTAITLRYKPNRIKKQTSKPYDCRPHLNSHWDIVPLKRKEKVVGEKVFWSLGLREWLNFQRERKWAVGLRMHHNIPHAAPKDATTSKGSLARCSIL